MGNSTPPLSKARKNALLRYVSRVRLELGLQRWTLHCIDEYPEQENAWASCEPIPGKYEALIRLSEDFFDQSPTKVREAIVHELFHLYSARLFHIVRDGPYQEQLADSVHTQLLFEFKREMEYMTDALTVQFMASCPLPPEWPR